MGINFPSSPVEGQVYKATTLNDLFFTFTNGKWEATPKRAQAFNFITNNAFQVSQEIGAVTTNVNGAHAADQWWFSTALTANVQVQQLDFASVNNSKYRYRAHVYAAKASLATAEYVIAPGHTIEGARFQSFGWGTAYPKNALLRFWLYAPQGTYAVSLRNGGTISRSYVIPIVVTAPLANVNTLWEFVIPADTANVFPRGESSGLHISWCWATGTQYQTPTTNTWVDGNFLAPTGISNGLATLNNMFELQDVGFYIDFDDSGLAPPWEANPDSVAISEAMRYWYKSFDVRGVSTGGTTVGRAGAVHMTTMRTAPSLSLSPTPPRFSDGSAIADIATMSPACSVRLLEFNATTAAAALVLGAAAVTGGTANYVAVNARM